MNSRPTISLNGTQYDNGVERVNKDVGISSLSKPASDLQVEIKPLKFLAVFLFELPIVSVHSFHTLLSSFAYTFSKHLPATRRLRRIFSIHQYLQL
jgi:hypothetical protein